MKKFRFIEVINIDEDKPYESPLELSFIVILDLTCGKSQKVLSEASKTKLFNKKTKWLLFSHNLNDSMAALKDLDINIDAMMLLLVKRNKDRAYTIFHLRSPALKRNGVMYVNLIGNYTNQRRLKLDDPFKCINFTLDGIFMKVGFSVSFLLSS